MSKKYDVKYNHQELKYTFLKYLQDIEDGIVSFPDVYELCAKRLKMRVSNLILIAKSDSEIADYFDRLISEMEYAVSDGMRTGNFSVEYGKHLLRQDIFGWRDKSVEQVEVKTEQVMDPELRRKILEEKDPEAILRLRNEALGRA